MKWLETEGEKIVGFVHPKNQSEAKKFAQEIEENCECLISNKKGRRQIELWYYPDGTVFRTVYDGTRMSMEIRDTTSDDYVLIFSNTSRGKQHGNKQVKKK